MKKGIFKSPIWTGILALFLSSQVLAIPVWTFTPQTATSITISSTETAVIEYELTNNSKEKSLQMRNITGVSQVQGANPMPCGDPIVLPSGGHCILSLQVVGNLLRGNVVGGPLLCENGNNQQCYQPSSANSLSIRLVNAPTTQYTVTSTAGPNGTISPSGAIVVNPGSSINYTATPTQGYSVLQWTVDGVVVQNGQNSYQLTNINANHTVNVTFGIANLVASVSNVALSVNCPVLVGACETSGANLTGNPRQFTVQNTGNLAAVNVQVTPANLPSDTTVNSTCSGNLNPGAQCTVTITPGQESSGLCAFGFIANPGTITISETGGSSVPVSAYVLNYGCVYQGGFLFAVDDSVGCGAPCTGSIGGKVVTTTDLSSLYWGPNATNIPAINETTQQGSNDGAANTQDIITTMTGLALPIDSYAAGNCTQISVESGGFMNCVAPNVCYNDWYLPAICEWTTNPAPLACDPGINNIEAQVNTHITDPLVTGFTALDYWTSTQFFADSNNAWTAQNGLAPAYGPYLQADLIKTDSIVYRCARLLTQ